MNVYCVTLKLLFKARFMTVFDPMCLLVLLDIKLCIMFEYLTTQQADYIIIHSEC